jgi:hypothetical protein
MRLLSSKIIVLVGASTLLIGACSKELKNSASAPVGTVTPATKTASTAIISSPATTPAKSESGGDRRQGGQVVESGKYHLEFVPEWGASETHLDLYLQKGDTHESIADAKVTANVQSPDGQLKTMPLSYDPGGKHYAAVVVGKNTGRYQVKVNVTIGSEKADGRFNFTR